MSVSLSRRGCAGSSNSESISSATKPGPPLSRSCLLISYGARSEFAAPRLESSNGKHRSLPAEWSQKLQAHHIGTRRRAAGASERGRGECTAHGDAEVADGPPRGRREREELRGVPAVMGDLHDLVDIALLEREAASVVVRAPNLRHRIRHECFRQLPRAGVAKTQTKERSARAHQG